MDRDTPSVRERRLAHELRVLRGTAELHGKDVAARLGWSPSKVSRIETGRIGVAADDLDRLLTLYRVSDEQATYLRRLAPASRQKGWWDAFADTLSSGYSSLIRLEAGSRSLQCYSALVPHALLQTPDYARQVIRSTWTAPSAAEVNRRVQVCRRRQQLLERGETREPLRFSTVIDEAVLRRQVPDSSEVDGATVLKGQLAHLAVASTWPNVELRILPFSAGLPPVTAGSFSVLESQASQAPDVVYLENKTRIFFIDSEAEVHGYGQEFSLLRSMALSPKESAQLLHDTAR